MLCSVIQMRCSDRPLENLEAAESMIRRAALDGAELIVTPECSNIMTSDAAIRAERVTGEDGDLMLARCLALARELSVWIVIGSLILRADDGDGHVNRSIVIAPTGKITARYDKIHMFDVSLGDGESYRESRIFRPGQTPVTVPLAHVTLGLSICYDLRFPGLYRTLAWAGAGILTIPAAFTVPTGRAHWHVLVRARAIETGCFVLAPAQEGRHQADRGKARATYGHSLIVSPWGEILAELPNGPGVAVHDLDLSEPDRRRGMIPALDQASPF